MRRTFFLFFLVTSWLAASCGGSISSETGPGAETVPPEAEVDGTPRNTIDHVPDASAGDAMDASMDRTVDAIETSNRVPDAEAERMADAPASLDATRDASDDRVDPVRDATHVDEHVDVATDAPVVASDAPIDVGADARQTPDASVAADAGDRSGPEAGDGGRLFRPVLLSESDKTSDVLLTPDRLSMEVVSLGRAGVRSDGAIVPRSGIFYFEGQRLVASSWMVIGVATARVPLDAIPSETDQGFSIDTGDGSWFDPRATSHYGFVVDYRQVNPTVHLLAETYTGRRVARSVTLARVTEPLYIFVGGLRRRIGPQVTINPGNDIVNFPFFYDPVALLETAGVPGADALVLGWGGSRSRPFDAPPVIAVSVDQTIPLGSPVTVTAIATDAEDGDLTAKIAWGDLATPRGARTSGTGPRFTITPTALGLHELSASVSDSGGKIATASVRVTVTGTLPVFSPVRLQPDNRSGGGITLTADGLGAHFAAPAKMGIRANQGLLRGFQYFEFHREAAAANLGGGLITADGNLAPYGPGDVPPSCSVNVLGGAWQELTFSSNFTDAQKNESYYGFAVDYRGTFPTIYVIVGGAVADVIRLTSATVPIYPMLYGNPVSSGPSPDLTINFGSRPFHYDPASALRAYGVDVAGFQLGWGATARPHN